MDNMPTLKSVPPAVAGGSSSMETSPTVSEGGFRSLSEKLVFVPLRVLRASVVLLF